MISFRIKGDFKNTERFFGNAQDKLPRSIRLIFDKYGKKGVEALKYYTPKDSGTTADSWTYELHNWGISWNNSNTISTGVPLALLIQYGHGTRNGAYVQGRDFLNPAIQPIFDQISNDIWKEVQNL